MTLYNFYWLFRIESALILFEKLVATMATLILLTFTPVTYWGEYVYLITLCSVIYHLFAFGLADSRVRVDCKNSKSMQLLLLCRIIVLAFIGLAFCIFPSKVNFYCLMYSISMLIECEFVAILKPKVLIGIRLCRSLIYFALVIVSLMGMIELFIIPALVAAVYFLIIMFAANFKGLGNINANENLTFKEIFKYTFSSLMFTVAQNTELIVYSVLTVNKETIAIYDYLTKFNNTLGGLLIASWPLLGLAQLKGLKSRINIIQIPVFILSLIITKALLVWKQCDVVPVYLMIISAASSLLMINYIILGRADEFLNSKYFIFSVISALVFELLFYACFGSLFQGVEVLVILNFLRILYLFIFHKAYTFVGKF